MVNQDILKYLKEGKKRGFSINLLKQKLTEAGFAAKDINEAAASLGGAEKSTDQKVVSAEMEPEKKPEPKKDNKPKYEMYNDPEAMKTIKDPFAHNEVGISSSKPPKKMGVFRKIGKSIVHPTDLFEKTRGEGIGKALVFYLIIALIPLIGFSLILGLFIDALSSYLTPVFDIIGGASSYFIGRSFLVTFSASLILIAVGLYVLGLVGIFIGSGITHLFIKLYGGKGSYSDTFRAMVYSMGPAYLFFFLLGIANIWTFVISLFGVSVNHDMSKLRAFFALITLPLLVGVIILAVWAILLLTG